MQFQVMKHFQNVLRCYRPISTAINFFSEYPCTNLYTIIRDTRHVDTTLSRGGVRIFTFALNGGRIDNFCLISPLFKYFNAKIAPKRGWLHLSPPPYLRL